MEADFQWTTQCYTPENRILHNHPCETYHTKFIQVYNLYALLIIILYELFVLLYFHLNIFFIS